MSFLTSLWGFYDGAVEGYVLLRYDAASPGIRSPTFRRNTVPSISRVQRSEAVEYRTPIPLKMVELCSFRKRRNDYPVTSSSHGATAPSGQGRPHYRGFTITPRHTTRGRTPLDEWSAWRKDLYQTTHKHSQETNIHSPGRIRTYDPRKRAAADQRLRPRDYWDRRLSSNTESNPIKEFSNLLTLKQVEIAVLCMRKVPNAYIFIHYKLVFSPLATFNYVFWPLSLRN
jgi:hypothetical protein